MGFTPRDVDEMSFWELQACSQGFAKANGAGAHRAPTDEEFEAALALLPD